MNAEVRYAVDDGAKLWTSVSGSGPPLLLCHGGPGLWDYFEPVAQMVNDLATVHRWDQRGCGRSSGDGPYTLARSVADIEDLRRQMQLDRWAVLGHSWGATLALQYALAHPSRVSGLIYLSGVFGSAWRPAYKAERLRRLDTVQRGRFLELDARARSPEEDRAYVILSWSTDFADRNTAFDLAETLLDGGFEPNYECNRALMAESDAIDESPLLERCRSFDVPVLIAHGAEDTRPVWALNPLVAALPRARLVVLEDVGHLPWLEHPERLQRELRQFLHDLPA